MRYLSRHKVYEKVDAKIDAKKIYIFCEGEEKEIKYFKYFQGFSSNIDIIPIPNTNGQSDPIKLKENAELLFFGKDEVLPVFELSSNYKDEVWFVIDTDRWNEGNKIDQLKKFCESKNTVTNSWAVMQSNPCFELWLYYHFHENAPTHEEVCKTSSFKEFVNIKIKGGFDNRSMPIELKSAIEYSIKNFVKENDQPKLYSTEVHELGKVIFNFVGSQLEKIKQMLSSKNVQ